MSVSIQAHDIGTAGVAYTFSDTNWSPTHAADAAAMVQAAQNMVVAASDRLSAALQTLAQAMRELAALEPPKPGPDGKVDQAAQAAYEQRVRDAKAKIARANDGVARANFAFRTAMEALDRANMMLPVARERDDAQRRVFEESKRLAEERQRQVDNAMRDALAASRELEAKDPEVGWAWDTVRTAGRDVNGGDMRLAGYLNGTRPKLEVATVEQTRHASATMGSGFVIGPSAAPRPPTTDAFVGKPSPGTAASRSIASKPNSHGLEVEGPLERTLQARSTAIATMLARGAIRVRVASSFDWGTLRGADNAAQIAALLRTRANDAQTQGNSDDAAVWLAAAERVAPTLLH